MWRDVFRPHVPDVFGERMIDTVAEVLVVGRSGVTLPFATENTPPPTASIPMRMPPIPENRSMKVKRAGRTLDGFSLPARDRRNLMADKRGLLRPFFQR